MRNLSYHVHKEVPGAEKFQDPSTLQAPGSAGPQRKKKDDAGCFGGKKAKGERDDGGTDDDFRLCNTNRIAIIPTIACREVKIVIISRSM